MPKKYDVCAVVSTYTDREGNTKKRYQNVGAVMTNDNGPYLLLSKWFAPAGVQDERGGESIILSLFEPKDNGQQQARPQQSAPSQDFDDDIPF